MDDSDDRTASLMTPAKLAQVSRPRAPASPAAWLDQMAADAGHQHLQRLAQLRGELQAQAGRRGLEPLSQALEQLGAALPQLDFTLLKPRGWWARTTGKSRSAGAEFTAQYERIEQAIRALTAQIQGLQKKQAGDAGALDRALVEFEVEFRAVDKIIDQGARWLQDMRNQLKARLAEATDPQSQQQVKDDAARCEILVVRLKSLRAAVTAAQQVHQQALAAAARRAALFQMLQQALSTDVKSWQVKLSALAAAAGEDRAAALTLEAPTQTHRELQLFVTQALADCAQLHAQEQAAARTLDALGESLGTA